MAAVLASDKNFRTVNQQQGSKLSIKNMSGKEKRACGALCGALIVAIVAIVLLITKSAAVPAPTVVAIQGGDAGIVATSGTDGLYVNWDLHKSVNTLWMVQVQPSDVDPFVVSGTSAVIKGLVPQQLYKVVITSNSGYGSLIYASSSVKYSGLQVVTTGLGTFIYNPTVVKTTDFRVGKAVAVSPTINCPNLPLSACVTTFTVAPPLPSGLVLDSATGKVSGTPTIVRDSVSYLVSALTVKGAVAQSILSFQVVGAQQAAGGCASSPCKNGSTCTESQSNPADFTCSACPSGWSGAHCDLNVNACDSNPCGQYGTCTDHHPLDPTPFSCTCSSGWQGPTCSIVQPVCDRTVCSNNGVCSESAPGVAVCTCPLGLSGPDCRDFNSCADVACGANSVAVASVLIGVPMCSCSCLPGYFGAGCQSVQVPLVASHFAVSNLANDQAVPVAPSTVTVAAGELVVTHRKFGFNELYMVDQTVTFTAVAGVTYDLTVTLAADDNSKLTELVVLFGTTLPLAVVADSSVTPIGQATLSLLAAKQWTGSVTATASSPVHLTLGFVFASTATSINKVNIASITAVQRVNQV